jgi:hypothetical protein
MGTAMVDHPNRRVDEDIDNALQVILFSAFALEYRMKRVLVSMGKKPPRNLKPLIDGFWPRLKDTPRLDGRGKCRAPQDWHSIEPRIKDLADRRDKIAHADYAHALRFFSPQAPPVTALDYYDAVIDAICSINVGTGYDTRPPKELVDYFERLRIVPQ